MLNWIIVGGPGRSGTSFVAERLLAHPLVCGFRDVELKFLSDIDGLPDLFLSLVTSYSPDRAQQAMHRARVLFGRVATNYFQETSVSHYASADLWNSYMETFAHSMMSLGQVTRQTPESFALKARSLLSSIGGLAAELKGLERSPLWFLEKTPHNCLQIRTIYQIMPDARFIHVMRDPRSVAASLSQTEWGPKTLAACVTWVGEYCKCWRDVRAWAQVSGIFVDEIFIEDVASHPYVSGIAILQRLGLSSDDPVFNDADLSRLNGWVDRFNKNDLDFIYSQLSNWAEWFGYHRDIVGQRV